MLCGRKHADVTAGGVSNVEDVAYAFGDFAFLECCCGCVWGNSLLGCGWTANAIKGVVRWDGVYCCELPVLGARDDVGVTRLVEDVLLPCFVDNGERCDVFGDLDSFGESFEDDRIAWMVEQHKNMWLVGIGDVGLRRRGCGTEFDG